LTNQSQTTFPPIKDGQYMLKEMWYQEKLKRCQ